MPQHYKAKKCKNEKCKKVGRRYLQAYQVRQQTNLVTDIPFQALTTKVTATCYRNKIRRNDKHIKIEAFEIPGIEQT